jgi:DnaK suppressor protein
VTEEPTMNDAATRNADMRHTLNQRRREMQDQIQSRKHEARSNRPVEEGDDLERSDAGIQGGIDAALLQMQAATLKRIDDALLRLDAGRYGICFECEAEISERRLRALPFAVRCQACEEQREQELGRTQRLDRQRGNLSLFPEAAQS